MMALRLRSIPVNRKKSDLIGKAMLWLLVQGVALVVLWSVWPGVRMVWERMGL